VFPLYFSWLLLFILLRPAIGNHFPWLMKEPLPLGWYATYTQNFEYARRNQWGESNWLAMTWSLAIEEQFYLLLPLLVYWLRPKSLAVLSIALIASAPVARYFLERGGYHIGTLVLLPARWDDLFLGVLAALFLSRKGAADKCRRHPILIQIPFFVFLALGILWIHDATIWRWPWLVSLQITLLGAFSLSMVFVPMAFICSIRESMGWCRDCSITPSRVYTSSAILDSWPSPSRYAWRLHTHRFVSLNLR
jgi:peptidoglycan/LPS O-acetylase OafA/YrhL